MWKLFLTIATIAFTGLWSDQDSSRLQWLTSYDEALSQSKSNSKPILLFFTGSDWCGWCHKLEKEVLNTSEFSDLAGQEFIFVTLDFPLYKATDSKASEQNKKLQKKYDVKGFPTIVLIDKNEQSIGSTGYRPGGAKAYAEYLMKMLGDYNQYKEKVSHVSQEPLSSSDLKSLYIKASELGCGDDAAHLVALGIASDEKIFFLLEQFRNLSTEGKVHDSQAQLIKKEIQSLDSNNERETQYELALIEFEAFSEEQIKENYTPEFAVAPLINYIQKYGERDKENVWKLQMIISQVFLDKNKLQQALEHAQASYESAPDPVKSDIATAIRNIKSALKK